MRLPFWSLKSSAAECETIARQKAEMENRNRAVTEKRKLLSRLLEELQERKRGDNHS